MDQPIINIERKFRPEIEGLRFIAALLVAIYHIWLNRVSGGVDVFFVISGFLITNSIVSTINRTGEFRFGPYIKNLLKRLLPSVLSILTIVTTLSFFFLPKSILIKTLKEVFASMFFYQNWQLAISNTDYLDVSQMKTPIEHFWALAIQGQFYIIWFLLFAGILFTIRKYSGVNVKGLINASLGFIFIISLAYSIYLTSDNQQWAYFTTFTRVWQFSLGSLVCINLSSIRLNKVVAIVIGWLGLVGLVLTGIIFDVSEMFPGYIALWPMVCAIFILLSGTQDIKGGVKVFLGSPWMVKIGGISFGIYLWHWVLLSFYKYNIQETPGFIAGALIITLSIILSYVMTKFIEEPIRLSNNDKTAFKRLVLIGSINLILVGSLFVGVILEQRQLKQKIANEDYPGAIAIHEYVDVPDKDPIPDLSQVHGDLPQSYIDGNNQTLKKTEVKIGEYGETENYNSTIALIGSSHTEHWQGAVLEAIKDYNYRVLVITRSATRFSAVYPKDDLKGVWIQNVLDYLKSADVDLIISQATASDTDEAHEQEQIMKQLEHVQSSYDIDVLAVRDVPRYSFNVLKSIEEDGVEATEEKMNQEYNQKDEDSWVKFKENNDSLHKIDLTDYFMVDGQYQPIIGNVIVYRDKNHITATYSKSFGPVFEEEIAKILRN